ncbi:MAG: hypothetical protein CM15mP49_25100 [Actinomycetota bacterium]|nr:MAG: hypothetical protein CM15mP49_25100 [Actinomycetota bacterium]
MGKGPVNSTAGVSPHANRSNQPPVMGRDCGKPIIGCIMLQRARIRILHGQWSRYRANYLNNSEITILDLMPTAGGTVNMLRDLNIDHVSANTTYQQTSSIHMMRIKNHMISVAKDDEEYLRKVDGILSDLDPALTLFI